MRASQYDHRSDTYKKKQLSDRWHVFRDGTKVQRDLYSAFLISHTNEDLDQVDRKTCIRNYKTFKQLHDEEIVRFTQTKRKDTALVYRIKNISVRLTALT